MKKLSTALLSVAVACFMLFAATSCTREYTCKCLITYSGVPGLPNPDTREYTITDTKDNAKSICEGNSSVSEKNGIKNVEDCQLW